MACFVTSFLICNEGLSAGERFLFKAQGTVQACIRKASDGKGHFRQNKHSIATVYGLSQFRQACSAASRELVFVLFGLRFAKLVFRFFHLLLDFRSVIHVGQFGRFLLGLGFG